MIGYTKSSAPATLRASEGVANSWIGATHMRSISPPVPDTCCASPGLRSSADRFWSKVDKTSSPHGCWLWIASIRRDGYGAFYFEGRGRLAHRIAWMLEHGAVPLGLNVLHACEAYYVRGDMTPRRCVRHLYLGTQKDNYHDMYMAGRWSCGNHAGESNGRAILTHDQVSKIREEFATGVISQAALARTYGIAAPTVGNIVRNEHWVCLEQRLARCHGEGEE